MIMFVSLFEIIQNSFSKRFHADSVVKEPIKALRVCKLITIGVEILFLIISKELNVSVYSNLFFIFVVAFLNALLQVGLERIVVENSSLKNRENLEYLCNKYNITELAKQRLIMRYIEKKSIKEIAMIENVEVETIKQSIRRSKRAMKIKVL